MSKKEFLSLLREKLQGLPKDDLEERISFYDEMIDDMVDEGKTEEGAVESLGGVDKVVEDIARETPLVRLVKEKIKPKRQLRAWEIVLLILGFPLWFPLALVGLILAFVFYLLIWVSVIVVYSIELALAVSSVAALITFFASLFSGSFNLAAFGAMFLCAGGAILLAFGCVGVTKGTIELSKNLMTKIKSLFIRKGDNK